MGAGSTRDGQSWDPVGREENLWVLGQHLREGGALFSDPAAAGTTSMASSLSIAAVGEGMSNTVPWLSLGWSRSRGRANPSG